MRIWRWLGAVLSLLWLVGFGGWLWISSVGDRPEWYALQLQRCYSSSNMDREKLQADAGEYDQRIADISRQYYFCTERVKATFDRQMDERRSQVGKIMAVNAGVVAAIWLLVLIAIAVRRWGAVRFHQWM
jgi:hypothetical protein